MNITHIWYLTEMELSTAVALTRKPSHSQ